MSEPLSTAFDFDAFATYATNPDRDLIRAVEGLVEGFHRRPSLPEHVRRELELCVDGRDFKIPRRARNAKAEPSAVADIVENYMKRCRSLVVFCGPASRNHPWIDHEVRWWLENRRGDPLYFALTHGNSTKPEDVMPPALLEAGGGDLDIYFDLRGFGGTWFNRRHTPAGVRPFGEEVAKLIARLLSDILGGDISIAEIEEAWAADERRVRRMRLVAIGASAAAALAGGLVFWELKVTADRAEAAARAESWLQRAQGFVDQGGTALPQALAYGASALSTRPDARVVGTLHAAMQGLLPIDKILKPDGGDPAWTAVPVGADDKVLIGGRSSILRLLDTRSGEVLARVDLKSAGIRAIAVDPEASTVFVGTDRAIVRLALTQEGRLTEIARDTPRSRVGGLVVDPRRARIVVGLLNGEIWSYPLGEADPWTGTRLSQIMDPRFAEEGMSDVPSGIYGLSLQQDRLVAIGIDGVVSILRASQPDAPPRQFVHPRSIFAMKVSHKGRELVLADDNGGLSVYDLETHNLIRADRVAPRSASVARNIAGQFEVADPDRLANVGLAISPDDTVLAVTSQDRSVRFLTFETLAPLGNAIHRAAARGVVFHTSGTRAITFSDDGALLVVRPLATPDTLRVAGVDDFAITGRTAVAWPTRPRPGAGLRRGPQPELSTPVFRLTLEGERQLLGHVAVDPSGAVVLDDETVALKAPGSTKVHLLRPGHSAGRCSILQHNNEPDAVDVVRDLWRGPMAGTIATRTERNGATTFAVHLWNAASCEIMLSASSARHAAVASGVIATTPEEKRVELRLVPEGRTASIMFARPVQRLSVSASGADTLVALSAPAEICLCTPTAAATAPVGNICGGAHSTTHMCRELPAPARHDRSEPSAVFLSPMGRSAVLHYGSEILVGTAAWDWKFRVLSPAQLRPVTPPHAFDAEEGLLAIPAGETGARVFDLQTGDVVADLPTPSRVLKLSFSNDPKPLLFTLDSNVLRVWHWQHDALFARLCERWSPDLDVAVAFGVAAPLPRSAVCPSAR